MTATTAGAVAPDWLAALRDERAELLAFCEALEPGDWKTASSAEGWSVQDVVAHIGSGCHAMFGPAIIGMMRSRDIEDTNDTFVDGRRDWPAQRVLAEYLTWSGRVITAARIVCRTPLRALSVPLAELGLFDMRLVLCGALTFDHHTHLRHDIAPAVNRPAPASDANRMTVVVAWMLAV